jgi:hypothetical protein
MGEQPEEAMSWDMGWDRIVGIYEGRWHWFILSNAECKYRVKVEINGAACIKVFLRLTSYCSI